MVGTRVRVAAIAAGGAAGALTRAALAEAFPADGSWPWGTFIANIIGTALLIWLVLWYAELMSPARPWRALLGTGLCGALTTFSALQVEVVDLVERGRAGIAVGYLAASLVAGLALALAIPPRQTG